MNKNEQIKLINDIQDNYVEQLEKRIRTKIINNDEFYEINFGSKTGTGKSVMITKLLNNCPDLFFMITTLSRGGLNKQLQTTLDEKAINNNFVCYGSCDLTANTKKDADDIWNEIINKNTNNKPIIWLRDEAHIKTNVFSAAFKKRVKVIVNISATNINQNDIDCNFTDTILLRHPKLYTMAHFDQAIEKLLEVKNQHKKVSNYNPCMVVRCLDETISKNLRLSAERKGLKCVDLNDDNVSTLSICDDNNEYDVIINKMKIIEGVDIRRCHVIYIQNNIGKESTNIQLVGRSRRNALLWRNDIDIFAEENSELLRQTLVSYIYYNNDKGLAQDSNGEFLSACCNVISVESLRPGCTIHVEDGRLANGYIVYELIDLTGDFKILVDPELGFNYVENLPSLYENILEELNFRPKVSVGADQAYIEGTDIILDKRDFIADKFNFATGKVISKFDGTVYHGAINSKIISKILPISEEEFDTGIIKGRYPLYNNFKFVKSNKLFSLLSGDTFTYSDSEYHYTPSVTSKLSSDTKLYNFIISKYQTEIENAPTFTGKNNFNFDKKCNSCLGYLVEYYSKYKLLGSDFLIPYLDQAIIEVQSLDDSFDFNSATEDVKTRVIIRACQLKYAEMMSKCFGDSIKQVIQQLRVSDLIKTNYDEWINTIIQLANNTVKFISNNMDYDGKTYPVLACSGIKGLADFISSDTIIDLKTTNYIDKKYVMQVLAYYELSKTRSDLNIKKVIVYDCVSNKFVEINNLDSQNYFNYQ